VPFVPFAKRRSAARKPRLSSSIDWPTAALRSALLPMPRSPLTASPRFRALTPISSRSVTATHMLLKSHPPMTSRLINSGGWRKSLHQTLANCKSWSQISVTRNNARGRTPFHDGPYGQDRAPGWPARTGRTRRVIDLRLAWIHRVIAGLGVSDAVGLVFRVSCFVLVSMRCGERLLGGLGGVFSGSGERVSWRWVAWLVGWSRLLRSGEFW